MLLMPINHLKAQNFEQDAIVLSAGYGFGNFGKFLFTKTVDLAIDSLGIFVKSRALGPIYFKAEYGVRERFGIGINVAYIGMNASWDADPFSYKVGFNNTSIMVRFNKYWINKNNFDFYTGFGMGFRGIGGWKIETKDAPFKIPIPNIFPFAFETTLGFRAYVTNNIAVYGEIGISKGFAQIGLTYKL